MLSLDTALALRTSPEYRARLAAYVARVRAYARATGLCPDLAERAARDHAEGMLSLGRMPRTDAEVAASPAVDADAAVTGAAWRASSVLALAPSTAPVRALAA